MTILAQAGVFSWALQWGKYGTGTVAAAKATAKINFAAQPADGKQMVVGSVTYTWKTTLTPAVNEIHIGTTLAISIANAVAAIQAGAGSGTAYGAGTLTNPDFDAVSAWHTIFLTADATGKAGNLLALSSNDSNVTVVAPANGVTAGSYDLTAQSYARHRAVDINYGPAQDTRGFPLEVGSTITPTGEYKAGAAVGGGATLIPRLQDTFGELLLAAFGSATKQADTPVAGAYTHTFSFDPNKLEEIPWVTVRKMIPGRGNARPVGITGIDNKLASLRIMVPQNDVVQTRVDFVGRIPQWDAYADAWLYANEYENAGKAMVSCKGSFKIPAFASSELPVTSVVIEFVNNVTTVREEMVVGSYNPDDYVVRSRAMQVRFVYKWADPDLYHLVYTGAVAGTDWVPTPYKTDYTGGNYAFEAVIEAVDNITGTTPYSLTIRAGSVVWEPVGDVVLQGGGILAIEMRGVVVQPDASLGVNYCDAILVNGRSTAYSVPAQP